MIRRAQESGELASIERAHLEVGMLTGYVVAHSEALVMVAVIDQEIRFNGFEIVRVEDITGFIAPAPQQDFVEDALRLRKLKRPRKPDVDLTNMGMALISLRDLTPLVTVSLELDEPGVPYIGRVETVSGETLTMLYIDADARYDEEATDYRLSEITRVNFGGGYEEALHLVSSARGGMGESSGFGAD